MNGICTRFPLVYKGRNAYNRSMTQKEFLTNNTAVNVNEVHRFGTDALLLARFCNVHRLESAADLGTGCGIIPLEWYDTGHRGRCIGVEICESAAALFAKSVAENNADNITAVQADMRTFCTDGNFDVVACNPPYFTAGARSQNAERAAARHEECCTLHDVCHTAFQLLKDGGRLCICLPPARLADAITCMKNERIEPKRLCLVRKTLADTPWLLLLQGQKNRASGMVLAPDICLQNSDGTPTQHAVYGKGE